MKPVDEKQAILSSISDKESFKETVTQPLLPSQGDTSSDPKDDIKKAATDEKNAVGSTLSGKNASISSVFVPVAEQPSITPLLDNKSAQVSEKYESLEAKQNSSQQSGQADIKQNDKKTEQNEIDQKEPAYTITYRKAGSFFLGSISGYAVGIMSAAQVKLILEYLGTGILPPWIGFLALPLPTLLNAAPLNIRENDEAFAVTESDDAIALEQKTENAFSLRKLMLEHPLSGFITTLAATAECLIVASCTRNVANDNDDAGIQLLAWALGLFAAGQYFSLEGRELIKRMRVGCTYEDPSYNNYLKNSSTLEWVEKIIKINALSILGALGTITLGLVECREILSKDLQKIIDPSIAKDVATIISGILGLIYGSMNYSAYGYLTKVFLADYFTARENSGNQLSFIDNFQPRHFLQVSSLRKTIVWSVASAGAFWESALIGVACAIATDFIFDNQVSAISLGLLFGLAGFLQNGFVEGREFLDCFFPEVANKRAERELPSGRSCYRFQHFFIDQIHLAILCASRLLVEVLIIPDSSHAPDEDREVTFGSYGYSAITSLLYYIAFQELPRFWELSTLKTHQLMTIDISNAKNNDEQYLKVRRLQNIRLAFYRSVPRLILQGILQFAVPLLMGTYTELALRE